MIKRRRFKQTEILEDRLGKEAIRLREEAKSLPAGMKREQLLRLARQAEIGAHMSDGSARRACNPRSKERPPRQRVVMWAITRPSARGMSEIFGAGPARCYFADVRAPVWVSASNQSFWPRHFSFRTPLNFFAVFLTAMNSPLVLLRFVEVLVSGFFNCVRFFTAPLRALSPLGLFTAIATSHFAK